MRSLVFFLGSAVMIAWEEAGRPLVIEKIYKLEEFVTSTKAGCGVAYRIHVVVIFK